MSAGNGSLMRLAPVALRCWNDRPALRDAAARQSRTTHGAAEAIDACIADAELITDAIASKPRSAVVAPRSGGYCGNVGPILAGTWRARLRGHIRASGYVAHTLEASLWSIARTGTFAEAVLSAANLGEDADTTAAVTGQLAGAVYGTTAIPPHWLVKFAWRERVEAMAARLFDRSLG